MTTNGQRLCWLVLASALALAPITSADEPDPAWPGDSPDGAGPAHDFGFPTGRCHAEMLAGALGGALGGLVGSRIGDGDGSTAAAAAGSVIGYLLGAAIGRGFDQMDESCAGNSAGRPRTERTVAG